MSAIKVFGKENGWLYCLVIDLSMETQMVILSLRQGPLRHRKHKEISQHFCGEQYSSH